MVVAFLVWRLLLTEGGPATIIFAIAAAMTLASLIVLATRRLLIATVVISALITTVAIASMLKLRAVNMVLHAYDLVFYLSSWSTVSFLWQNYRGYAVALLAALLVTGLTACLAYRFDCTRIKRRHAAGAGALFAAIAWLAVMAMGERRHSQFEYEGQYISSFFLSWSETIETSVARPTHRSGGQCSGPHIHDTNRLRTGNQTAAYHTDSSRICGAAVVFSDTEIR